MSSPIVSNIIILILLEYGNTISSFKFDKKIRYQIRRMYLMDNTMTN